MGSITYNFLADSYFFNEREFDSGFKDYSDDKIYLELEKYRNHCLNNFEELKNEISKNKSSLKVFATIDDISLSFLSQTALYIQQFIISDPLFKLTERSGEQTEVMSSYLGFNPPSLDRDKLISVLRFLKKITPFIVNDYVKILPYNIFFETSKKIPFRLPKDYDNGILPKPILDFFKERTIVSPLTKMENGGWAIIDGELKPTRAINIRYKDLDIRNGEIFFLFQTEITDFNEETGVAQFRQHLPETPPDIEHFNAWVTQSINQSAKRVFDKIYLENMIASSIESTFLCNNNFTSSLLNQVFEQKENIKTFTANELINLDLPFINNIDPNKLMEIRKYEENVFTNFRVELERNFREIRCLTDPKEINLKRENIIHELNDVQLSKIDLKFSHIKKQIGVNATILTGSLLASSITNGFSLLAMIHTIAKGYKSYNDYIKDVKMNPSYMLWKIKKK